MKLQDYALSGIAGTICLSFLAVVLLPAFGLKVDEATRVYVFGLFTLVSGSVGTWFVANKTTDARTAEMFQRQRAEILTLKAKGNEER